MEEAKETPIKSTDKAPFLLRVVSTMIIVEGTIGILFFTTVFIVQMVQPAFLTNWGYGQYYGNLLYLVIVIYAVVHCGLAISGFYMLKLNRKGIYIALLSIVMLLATGFMLHDKINWMGTIAGFFVFILLSFYVKSFR